MNVNSTESILEIYRFYSNDILFNATGKEQISELDVSEVLHQNSSTQETSDGQYLRFASSPNSDNGTRTKIIKSLRFFFTLDVSHMLTIVMLVSVEHPYAQVQNVQKTEVNKSNR